MAFSKSSRLSCQISLDAWMAAVTVFLVEHPNPAIVTQVCRRSQTNQSRI